MLIVFIWPLEAVFLLFWRTVRPGPPLPGLALLFLPFPTSGAPACPLRRHKLGCHLFLKYLSLAVRRLLRLAYADNAVVFVEPELVRAYNADLAIIFLSQYVPFHDSTSFL